MRVSSLTFILLNQIQIHLYCNCRWYKLHIIHDYISFLAKVSIPGLFILFISPLAAPPFHKFYILILILFVYSFIILHLFLCSPPLQFTNQWKIDYVMVFRSFVFWARLLVIKLFMIASKYIFVKLHKWDWLLFLQGK